MNKNYRLKHRVLYSVIGLITLMMLLTACAGKTESKKVESLEDIPGSKIGVQLGTTGDTYVTDYEGDDEGTTIIRYNKGADAIQALKQGKIDCVMIDEQPALAYVEKIVN